MARISSGSRGEPAAGVAGTSDMPTTSGPGPRRESAAGAAAPGAGWPASERRAWSGRVAPPSLALRMTSLVMSISLCCGQTTAAEFSTRLKRSRVAMRLMARYTFSWIGCVARICSCWKSCSVRITDSWNCIAFCSNSWRFFWKTSGRSTDSCFLSSSPIFWISSRLASSSFFFLSALPWARQDALALVGVGHRALHIDDGDLLLRLGCRTVDQAGEGKAAKEGHGGDNQGAVPLSERRDIATSSCALVSSGKALLIPGALVNSSSGCGQDRPVRVARRRWLADPGIENTASPMNLSGLCGLLPGPERGRLLAAARDPPQQRRILMSQTANQTANQPAVQIDPAHSQITPFLWFNDKAEEAISFYTSIFPDSRVLGMQRYGEGAPFPKGTMMSATFVIAGRSFMAPNGGPLYSFTPAISLLVRCETQDEVDTLWERLTSGGEPGRCGWLKDRGLTWQIIPTTLLRLLGIRTLGGRARDAGDADYEQDRYRGTGAGGRWGDLATCGSGAGGGGRRGARPIAPSPAVGRRRRAKTGSPWRRCRDLRAAADWRHLRPYRAAALPVSVTSAHE